MTGALESLGEAFCEAQGSIILRTLSRLSLGEPLDDENRAVLPLLGQLGLGRQNAAGFTLDGFGHKCADTAREYLFWTGRGRRLPFERSMPALQADDFKDRRVLEIGSGWGCNLFSLQRLTPHVRGREIEPVYARFTPIFAKMEGIEPPPIDVGGGEELPYPENSFDWVLIWSAMQFMDIQVVVREVARVLVPGGRLLTTQPLLRLLLREFPGAIRRPREFVRKSMTLANSMAYGWTGRRLFGSVSGKSTVRPVYLTRRRFVSLIESNGLHVVPTFVVQQGLDLIVVAEKPVGRES